MEGEASDGEVRGVQYPSVLDLRSPEVLGGRLGSFRRQDQDEKVELAKSNVVRIIHKYNAKRSCCKACEWTAGWGDTNLAVKATLSRKH